MVFWRSTARALALGLFDRGDGISDARLDWLEADVAAFLAAAGPKTSFLFGLVLTAIELLPPWFGAGPSRFSRLAPANRLAFLERLDASRLAVLIALPKAVLSLCYYEHPDALRETGYDGGCMVGELPAGTGLVQLGPRGPSVREEVR